MAGAEINLRRLLECLDYPLIETIKFDADHDLQQLVVWLEDRKVRGLDVSERLPLRTFDKGWDDAMAQYLLTLGCPLHWRDGNNINCLIWLVNSAVALEYEDNRDQLMNCEASMRVNCEAELTLSIDKVASAVGLSRRNTESDLDLLERIERHCRFVLSPSPGEAPTDGSSITLDSFPLGFDTTNDKVNDAAKVLKLLYLDDLREVQREFNSLVALGQEFTANPRTNTTLGKVGR